MLRKILGTAVLLLLLGSPTAARADPLLMFLISVAKEVATRSMRDQAAAPRTLPQAEASYPGTVVRPRQLRDLIDASFTYLSEAQRDEVFQALHAELLKPGNQAVNAPLLEHFAARAWQVRHAQEQLSRLSGRERQRLASGFRAELKGMSDEDVEVMRRALEGGLLPLPADLSQLLLAALDERPS